jgi:hypothetical protein
VLVACYIYNLYRDETTDGWASQWHESEDLAAPGARDIIRRKAEQGMKVQVLQKIQQRAGKKVRTTQ